MFNNHNRTQPNEPGLWQLNHERERYRVPANGFVVIELFSGDNMTIIDPEGGQIAEITPFDEKGKTIAFVHKMLGELEGFVNESNLCIKRLERTGPNNFLVEVSKESGWCI